MIFILVGKSCSGKTTLAKEMERWGCERIVTYTTRKPRPGEVDGKDYHFISEEYFKQKKALGFFMETASYEMTDGKVWYGSAKSDYISHGLDRVIVLNPEGVYQVQPDWVKRRDPSIKVIFLDTDDDIRYYRAIKRGDKPEEIKKRFKVEESSFKFLGTMYDIRIQEDLYLPEEIAEWLTSYPSRRRYGVYRTHE